MIEIIGGLTEDDEKRVHEFKDKVFDAAAISIEWCTACVVHFNLDGKPLECRTGVLIEIADMQFVVTACHHMIDHFDAGHIPCFLSIGPGKDPVQIQEDFKLTVDDQEDIAVAKLYPETVKALGDQFRFLHLKDMISQNSTLHGSGLYLVLGYPADMMTTDENGGRRGDTWKYLTLPFMGSASCVTNYDPGLHLVLGYDRATVNRNGGKVHPPGLSGCGVWLTGFPQTHPLFNTKDFKLVGIQTAWHSQHEYVKATWIDTPLLIIWRYFPETRAAMKLNGIDFTGQA